MDSFLNQFSSSNFSLSPHSILSRFKTDVPPSERPELLLKKIGQCNVIFDFKEALSDLKGKEIKRATLNELVDYISNNRNVITENVYPAIINMV